MIHFQLVHFQSLRSLCSGNWRSEGGGTCKSWDSKCQNTEPQFKELEATKYLFIHITETLVVSADSQIQKTSSSIPLSLCLFPLPHLSSYFLHVAVILRQMPQPFSKSIKKKKKRAFSLLPVFPQKSKNRARLVLIEP